MKAQTSGQNRKSAGFTLIEMLVVIAIIALLTAIVMPSVSRGMRNAKRVREINNLRQMAQAVLAYHAENNRLPGRLNRAVRIPSHVPGNQRERWFSTYMADMGFLPEDDALFSPVIDYGIRESGHGFILNNTVRSDPPNFFGRRSDNTSLIRPPVQIHHIRSNIRNQDPALEDITNIWMITNLDGQNYGAATTAGSEFSVPADIVTPWGGRHFVFFDGRVEFRKPGEFPSHD